MDFNTHKSCRTSIPAERYNSQSSDTPCMIPQHDLEESISPFFGHVSVDQHRKKLSAHSDLLDAAGRSSTLSTRRCARVRPPPSIPLCSMRQRGFELPSMRGSSGMGFSTHSDLLNAAGRSSTLSTRRCARVRPPPSIPLCSMRQRGFELPSMQGSSGMGFSTHSDLLNAAGRSSTLSTRRCARVRPPPSIPLCSMRQRGFELPSMQGSSGMGFSAHSDLLNAAGRSSTLSTRRCARVRPPPSIPLCSMRQRGFELPSMRGSSGMGFSAHSDLLNAAGRSSTLSTRSRARVRPPPSIPLCSMRQHGFELPSMRGSSGMGFSAHSDLLNAAGRSSTLSTRSRARVRPPPSIPLCSMRQHGFELPSMRGSSGMGFSAHSDLLNAAGRSSTLSTRRCAWFRSAPSSCPDPLNISPRA
ncbi:hypothetical protein DFP72DRAFT_184471 [Ephemerocybe angulata]|uniref:Uncharacterized protein n=1 Tax=Ephemerocybe angulata TaxID=980116 RepID=A0A8H6LVK2_9AGAR|nr:hypothetical protein DFP72DRAFT_184471 [Tulosesus angulatus]